MRYDPVKDRLGAFFSRRPLLQKLFYRLLDLFFLRSWYVRREVKRLLGAYPSSRRLDVLDAGTGFGQYAYFIARTFPNARVLAVDVKHDYLENARRFFARTPCADRVTLACEDLTDLKAEGPFDLILSVDVMEHIEDDRAVFRHFARVLRPGGHVLINTPSDLGGSDVHAAGEEGFIEEHVRDGYNRDELAAKLREAGLEPVRARYTYGPPGALAWRLMIKYPMLLLGKSWLFALVLPLYYLPVLPLGMLLHALDLRGEHAAGTGLLVLARKPAASA
ncbi:methyltransferase domain-containing protein [Rhodocaloribacter litoris]|uniref:class I SAM-dependent methyltransferase n=1 Tax=Rhodocaloribacter litoris TaxID=2558931 RepID=UPI00141E8231|nr:class I SAM-dependent methyltransferase [Rhodocaloribacter litoris]QXD17089.1 methyltransferase domain-containing protein [Rhodocaloribacter litoris]